MPNLNYKRSRAREYKVFHDYEKKGWLVFRSAGSHGFADVVAIKPTKCGHPSHFEVQFIQIKVSKNLKTQHEYIEAFPTPIGLVNLKTIKYPVKEKSKAIKMKFKTENGENIFHPYRKGAKHDRRYSTKARNRTK